MHDGFGFVKSFPRPFRLLVTGDRNWTDGAFISHTLRTIGPADISLLIHGGAAGADTWAGHAAAALGIEVVACPADWQRHGRGAGPVRNATMLNRYRPDMVMAFHDNLAASKGTKDMVNLARTISLPVVVMSHTATEVRFTYNAQTDWVHEFLTKLGKPYGEESSRSTKPMATP